MVETLFTLLFIITGLAYSMTMLTAVQQNAYRAPENLYPRKSFFLENFALVICAAVSVCLSFFVPVGGTAAAFITLVASLCYFIPVYLKKRTKYKFTPRGIRMFILFFVIMAVFHTIASVMIKDVSFFFLAHFIILISARVIACLCATIIRPFENLNNKRYINEAKNKIANLNAVKIGITGSFGKTGCKNILAAMLSKKYKVIKTRENYNTPMGICLTAKEIKGDEEIFIAEMGARRTGDIKELCDIVNPTYGIITGVGNQHLASFKTEDNIYRTKKELIDWLPPHGFAVFNGDNEKSKQMRERCAAESALVSLSDASVVHGENIRLTNAGSSFEIIGLGEPFAVTTKLLGRHNILNILMCAVLSNKLGLSNNDIAEAVRELKPVPHRLELVENSRSVTIIDDSYNANEEGAAFAVEVLKGFEGRKIVFTQGIVELGKMQFESNARLGAVIATVADIVILTGENSAALRKGLDRAGFSGRTYYYKNLEEVKAAFATVLKAGDVLLIQNDIP